MCIRDRVLHSADAAALVEADRLSARLAASGHTVVAATGDADSLASVIAVDEASFAEELDLAISLGGDGTVLRTVSLVGEASVKILGVNFGNLGYLTVIEPDELDNAVQRCLNGEHEIEERMLVSATSGDTTVHALNEIVIERAPGDTTVRIGVTVDGSPFTSYPADGLIVATPTGSTAYSMSARGPIVFPTHYAMLLTPVSPHMLFDRSLVLGPDSVIELTVEGHRPAGLSYDGNMVMVMEPGQTITCSRSHRVAKFVIFDARDNLAVLKSKLGIADR